MPQLKRNNENARDLSQKSKLGAHFFKIVTTLRILNNVRFSTLHNFYNNNNEIFNKNKYL